MYFIALPRFAQSACLLAVFGVPLLAGCNPFQSYPGRDGVARWVGPGCTLVAVQDMEHLRQRDEKSGLKRVSYPYQADCVPEGGSTPRRVSSTMVFEQRQEWFVKVWGVGYSKVNLDHEPSVSVKSGAPAVATQTAPEPSASERIAAAQRAATQGGGVVSNPNPNAGADASAGLTLATPDCEAFVKRVVAEVLPCLQAQRPDLVAPIQAQVDEYRRRSLVTVNTANRAAAELARDAQCLAHWDQVNRWLPSGTAPGACGLKN